LAASPARIESLPATQMNDTRISLLTGCRDKPYALGLATALAAAGMKVDFVGGNELDSPELRGNPQINFLNLRGDQSVDVGLVQKMARVLVYYFRLIVYAAGTKQKIIHILWNNKFEVFDRTALMLFYKLLGKRITFTAHNVNIGKRDGHDSFLNRLSLKMQYLLSDHIFVHTGKMKDELLAEFNLPENKISVIPLGINRTVPNTALTGAEARRRLGIDAHDKVILFFGQIAPYKGLEFLVAAFDELVKSDSSCRLIIVGRPKGPKSYWNDIRETLARSDARRCIIQKIEFVPDEETELYFKAADALVLPYVNIFQSGVLFLSYSFGLPVIAADVGSLKEEIFDGKTGLVFEAKSAAALTRAIQKYFESDLYRELNIRRREIQDFASDRYSWSKVAAITTAVYSQLLPEEKHYCPHCTPEKS
jgi:glycosyltransferase involved in cell wall biosynthesis